MAVRKNFNNKTFDSFLPVELAAACNDLTNFLLSSNSEQMRGAKYSDEKNTYPILWDKDLDKKSLPFHPWYTNFSWDPPLNEMRSSPPPVLCHNFLCTRWGTHILQEINHVVEKKIPGSTISIAQFFVWTKGSSIWWHDDSAPDRSGAVTIYLNNTWDFVNGGHLIYVPKDKWQERTRCPPPNHPDQIIVTPAFNHAVYIEAATWHRTTEVTGDNIRKSIQIWLKEKPKIIN